MRFGIILDNHIDRIRSPVAHILKLSLSNPESVRRHDGAYTIQYYVVVGSSIDRSSYRHCTHEHS